MGQNAKPSFRKSVRPSAFPPRGICHARRVIGGNDSTFPCPKQAGILEVEASRAGVQGVHYGRDGARPSRCGRDRLGGTPRPTLRPRRSAALTVWPQGQWHPCLSQWHVRKPSGTTKAPRQWFSNDLPLVCALAVLPCAPCRAPTVSKCSAQGKALRKDARGTGMAEERIERSTCLSQAFGAPRGLCEALSQ